MQVGDRPQHRRSEIEQVDTPLRQSSHRLLSTLAAGQLDVAHVRLHRIEVHGESFQRVDALGQGARPCVILGQPLDVVLQGVQPGRGQDTGLAHAATEQFPPAVRPLDEVGIPGHERTHWSPQSLGEADGDGVAVPYHP